MSTEGKFSKGSTVLVSVPSNLNTEQSQAVLAEILRAAGHPTCFSGFKFQFLDEAEAMSAHIAVGKDLKATVAR
jgi:hypothetical protein